MGHVANTAEIRNAYKIMDGKPEGKKNYGGVGVDEGIILKQSLKEWCSRVWTVIFWLLGSNGGLLKNSNKFCF